MKKWKTTLGDIRSSEFGLPINISNVEYNESTQEIFFPSKETKPLKYKYILQFYTPVSIWKPKITIDDLNPKIEWISVSFYRGINSAKKEMIKLKQTYPGVFRIIKITDYEVIK